MESASGRYWSTFPLILLIAADLAFIGLEVLHAWGYANDPKFSLGAERGYAEVYQYVKFFWAASILTRFALEKRKPLYGVGALVFWYLLLDDSLAIHESVGVSMAAWLGLEPAFGLRGQDYGELAWSVLAAVFFLVSGWWAYRRSDSLTRKIGLYLLAGVFVLAIFSVGIDMIHEMVGSRVAWAETSLLVLEDGGELIAASAITWFIYSWADQRLARLQVRSPITQV